MLLPVWLALLPFKYSLLFVPLGAPFFLVGTGSLIGEYLERRHSILIDAKGITWVKRFKPTSLSWDLIEQVSVETQYIRG